MNIFFGKISQKVDINQINEGYYIAPKGSSWYGDLEIGDLVYLIGGDKIQFWKAKGWNTKNGKDILKFEILNPDLGINVSQLIALKFLYLTKALAVLTSRSARSKAFFKLDLLKDIPLSDLSNSQFYKNPELYRSIKIVNSKDVIKNSEDIQLTFENNKLELVGNDFIDNSIKNQFVDNLDKRGNGAKMKDPVLNYFFKATTNLPTTISHKEIGLRRFYDTFFCEYKNNEKYFLVGAFWDTENPQDQTERFIKESIWSNGYTDKFNKEVNAVPVGSNIAIKSAFVREKTKSVMSIKARGIVTKNLNDGQTLEMEWEEDFKPFEVNFGGYRQTIKEVNKKDQIQAIWNDEVQLSKENNSQINNNLSHMYIPKNQILYGPPGTGKTYNTILEAAKIISGNESISYEDALEVFNINLNNQIEFITFHQNYTYEDFIQGIRPDIENEKELSFEKKDGVFKRIADRALFEYYIENQKLKTTPNELFVDATEAYLDFFNQLSVGQEFATKKNKKINIIQLNKNKNIVFKYEKGSKPVLVSSNRLLKLYSKIPDINQIQNINEDVRAAIGGCDASAYYTMLREFIIFYDENKKRIQDEEDYQDTDYLDITEERKKEILSQITLNELRNISKDSVKKYVIIIDEINRANISRVFGELITLIEEDKRSHGKIPMRVTLPSGDTFIVPSNLHIIGTMNTADKSIALLDIALRRRFEFVPMYPLYEGFKDSIYFPDILQKMNEKIKKIKGPDFQIGHAYFMENDNLLEIMNRKVIPLLLEYFMNDETQVKEIITIDGYLVDENSWPMKLNKA